MNIIDISSDLLRAEVYPGDPEPRVHAIERLDNDDEFDVTALYACLHSGTHVDAPSHVFSQKDGHRPAAREVHRTGHGRGHPAGTAHGPRDRTVLPAVLGPDHPAVSGGL